MEKEKGLPPKKNFVFSLLGHLRQNKNPTGMIKFRGEEIILFYTEDFGRTLHRKNLFVIKDNGVRGERGNGEKGNI